MSDYENVWDEISDRTSDLESLKRRYLISKGWEHRCDNPASMWLWHKTIDDMGYSVNMETAMLFEENSDE